MSALRLTLLALGLLGLVEAGALGAQESAETLSDLSDAPPIEIFTRSNALFESARSEEELRQAAAGYETLLRKGPRNGHLHYNLGNTYLRLGDHGRAILHFRRALRYIPDDPYARAMLDEARRQVREQSPGLYRQEPRDDLLNTLFFWHFQTSFRGRLTVLVIASAAFWLLLAVRLRARLPLHRFALATLLVVSIITGTSLALETLAGTGLDAVVTADEVEVRSGKGLEFELALDRPVPSGVEVTVLETRGQWHLIQFPDTSVGWVPEHTVEPVVEAVD